MSDIVRVLRILEYTGSREWVEQTLRNGGVPAKGEHRQGNNHIRSAIIGDYPEILEKQQNGQESDTNSPGNRVVDQTSVSTRSDYLSTFLREIGNREDDIGGVIPGPDSPD